MSDVELYNDDIRDLQRSIKKLQEEIAQKNGELADQEQYLETLKSKRKSEKEKLMDKLRKLSEDFIRDVLYAREHPEDDHEGLFPGLAGLLADVYIKIEWRLDAAQLVSLEGVGYKGSKLMLIYKAFNPQKTTYCGETYFNNAYEKPSILLEGDPNYDRFLKALSYKYVLIDCTYYGSEGWRNYFLPVLLFFIEEKDNSYEDAISETLSFFEVTSMESVYDRLYGML